MHFFIFYFFVFYNYGKEANFKSINTHNLCVLFGDFYKSWDKMVTKVNYLLNSQMSTGENGVLWHLHLAVSSFNCFMLELSSATLSHFG